MNVQKGLIHKIERVSLHDGPGIRTLVVMKGCPLRCLWCSSPHTQSPNHEILHIKARCHGCGHCIAVCKNQAIASDTVETPVKMDRSRCIGCGECITVCANEARELSGRYYAVEEVFYESNTQENEDQLKEDNL